MNDIIALTDIFLPLNPETCWWVTISLLHTVWQVLLIAGLALLFSRYSQVSVHTKFRLAFAALALIGLTPFLNYAWISQSDSPASVVVAAEDYAKTGRMKLFALNELSSTESSSEGVPLNSHSRNAQPMPSLAKTSETQMPQRQIASVAQDLPKNKWLGLGTALITLGYLIGVIAMAFRLGRGLHQQHQFTGAAQRDLRQYATPDSILKAGHSAANSLYRKLKTPIAIFAGQGTAFVAGILRPVIFVNTTLATGLTPTQLEQILAHELAHVYRFDTLTQLIQRLVESVLFYHPAVWYLSREVSQLRELCCDDWVAQSCSPAEYADTLLQCFLLNQPGRPSLDPGLALSATGARSSSLTARIDTLLAAKPRRKTWRPKYTAQSPTKTVPLGIRLVLAVTLGLLALSFISWPAIPMLAGGLAQVTEGSNRKDKPLLAVDPDWNWQKVAIEDIKDDSILFNGAKLPLESNIPDDIEIEAMVDADQCLFAQWHFGDSTSTRLAVLLEIERESVGRVWVDANRNRKIEQNEELTTRVRDGKSWIADVTAEVTPGQSTALAPRQIAITPIRQLSDSSVGFKKTRITTLGYATGKTEIAGVERAVRRIDRDGNGLPIDGTDQIWIDLDSDGEFDLISEQFSLGSSIEIDGQRHHVRSDRIGHCLQLTPETERGQIQFLYELSDKTATLDTLEGSLRDQSGMLISIRLTDQPIDVPPGRYCIENLIVQAHQTDGSLWRMTLTRQGDTGWIEVNANEQQDVRLLHGFEFSAKPVHETNHWSGHITNLKPKLHTANGLVVTGFVHRLATEDVHDRQELDDVSFKIRSAEGLESDKPATQCSGFN